MRVTRARLGGGLTALLMSVALGACSSEGSDASSGLPPELRSGAIAKLPPALIDSLGRGEERTLIVVLDEGFVLRERADRAIDALADLDLRNANRAALFSRVKHDLTVPVDPAALQIEREFDQLPLVAVKTRDLATLIRYVDAPDVSHVVEETFFEANDTASFGLIKQPAALAAGLDGAGTSVVVIDTGCDYSRADLGTCTAPGVPASTCRVAYAADMAPNDGSLDANGHGTNVSGIIAGLAPGTKIIALDAFNGSGASSVDIIAAVNWAIANRSTYNIVAMNLSLGGGRFTSSCPTDSMAVALASARAAGIVPVVASGNAAYKDSAASPACAPAAVSVGAVYSSSIASSVGFGSCSDVAPPAGRVTCFSNSPSYLTLLAPGTYVQAAGLTMTGTSQAAPHVAGAVAALRGAYPTETIDQIVARMTTTGPVITDPANSRSTPLLDVAAAGNGCSYKLTPTSQAVGSAGATFSISVATAANCAWSMSSSGTWLTASGASGATGPGLVTWVAAPNSGALRTATLTVSGSGVARTVLVSQGADATSPTGSLSINGGAAYTRASTVALSITGSDSSGVAKMCVSNSTTCTAWETFAAGKSWTLGATGLTTVYLFLQDGRGNSTSSASPIKATITYDPGVPTGGAVTATAGNAKSTLAWSSFIDALTPITAYRAVYATGATAPASCAVGTVAFEGFATTFAHQGLANGTTYAYRVCAIDAAGNVSAGVTASAAPRPEFDPPIGMLSVASPYTTASTVAVQVSATDASGVASMCVGTAATCTAWEAFAPTKTVAVSGSKTIYAWFRDVWGNTSTVPATVAVVQDATAPTNGTVTGVGSSGKYALSWSGYADAGSGILDYIVSATSGTTAPAKCTVAGSLYAGSALAFTATGLVDGQVYSFRVCARDQAGNISSGSTFSGYPAPEYLPPAGSVVINGGAKFTNVRVATLTLSAADPAGVVSMCVSLTTACTTWVPYSTTMSVTLGSSGVNTVYVRFKDGFGTPNSTPFSAAITYDPAAPVDGSLKLTGSTETINVEWAGYSDALSPIVSYRVHVQPGAVAPTSCSAATLVGTASASPFIHRGLLDGQQYSYRVCAVDSAGNVSVGKTGTHYPAPEYVPPTGSVVINGGAKYTNLQTANLAVTAADPSGVASMCISVSTTCTAWVPFSVTTTVTLGSNGVNTVSVWFKDVYGTASTVPVSSTITYDSAAPTGGVLKLTGSAGAISVAWSGFVDSLTPITGYSIHAIPGTTAPATCTATSPLAVQAASPYVHRGLTDGQVYSYRVCAIDAAGNVSLGATGSSYPAPEYVPPTGSISINGGSKYTNESTATVTINASDASGVSAVCLSTSASCTAWTAYSSTKTVSLTASGLNTVYAWFKDGYGTASTTPVTSTITYDRVVPTGGALTFTGSSGAVNVAWSGFSDTLSPIVSYQVHALAGTTAPATCTAATLVGSAAASPYVHANLVNGQVYSYRVCAVDAAGNVSAGATGAFYAAPEYAAPTGSIVVNGGSKYTNVATITVAISATDASGVDSVCLSTSPTCSIWTTYASTKTITLAGSGLTTVYARFKDVYGTASLTPVTATITYDPGAPTNGTLSFTGSSGKVNVAWSGFADSVSPIVSYQVHGQPGTTAPTSCTAATLLGAQAASPFVHAGLTDGQRYAYRVCAVDSAGNVSAGSTGSSYPAPEYAAPTGSIAIDGGAKYTKGLTATLTLNATDASGVASSCVSKTNSCSAWTSYWATQTITLSANSTNTVYVWFKDVYGTATTAPLTASVIQDSVAPTMGTMTATTASKTATLKWTAASDGLSGLAGYTLVRGASTVTCATGTVVYSGTALTYSDTSASAGLVYYLLCGTDNAGNQASRAALAVTVPP